MSWTTPRDLEAQLARRWERGELARALVFGEGAWPLRLAVKGPGSPDLTDRFEAVRGWAAELAAMPHVRVEWRELRHRVQGQQRLPAEVWVDTPEEAVALLGRRRDARTLRRLVDQTRDGLPAVLPWLARRPIVAIGLADRWSRLLAIARWMARHPRPGLYLRQVDVAGVDSKFIEAHRAVLAELLDLALPAEAVDATCTGAGQFCRRYGFLDKPERIRFRVLDASLRLLPGGGPYPDITLDAASFAAIDVPVRRVFITENETNFLAFPPVDAAIVIFGAGYGWEALGRARWLGGCALHYWGDIDTHGFAILDQLRARFGHVASFLMDHETLRAHEAHWGEEPEPAGHDLPRLTPDERALYDDLRGNRIRSRLRLEQERIGFGWLQQALSRLVAEARERADLGG